MASDESSEVCDIQPHKKLKKDLTEDLPRSSINLTESFPEQKEHEEIRSDTEIVAKCDIQPNKKLKTDSEDLPRSSINSSESFPEHKEHKEIRHDTEMVAKCDVQPHKKLKTDSEDLLRSSVNSTESFPEQKEHKETRSDTEMIAKCLSEKLDPLAYTKTGEFTSEIFKIVIDNVPKYASPADTKKFLKKHKLDPVKVKRPMKKTYAYVTFRNEECRQNALAILNGLVWKKSTLKANPARPDDNPIAKNKSGDIDNRSVREKTAPLHDMEYSNQLETKMSEIQSVLNGYKQSLSKSWYTGFLEEDYEFHISQIKPSPTIKGYRNKCEFSIGKNVETNDTHCVGFVKGRFQSGNISIEEPYDCLETCSDIMIEEVKKFKTFIVDSEFPTYDNVANVGVWKALEIRTTNCCSVMVTPIVDKRQLDSEQLQKLKSSLISFYDDRKKFSLFLKMVGGKEEIIHLSGPEFMVERLCGYDFQITSGSFFQVNTAAAEILYQTIKDAACLDMNTHLLDICCGTGTIGIILSQYVKHVYGIEIVESAVKDARKNATRNNIENISFYAGDARRIAPKVVNQIPKSDEARVVAVVDPPRNGLHLDVISCLRRNVMITELVYVSCDIKQITGNIVSLCGPTSGRYLGDPFKFVNAVAVDLFPHTRKYEVVFYFKR